MSALNWAGFTLIAAFIMLATGALLAPQNVYSGSNLQKRLHSLRSQQARWKISKVFDGLAVVLPAAGFLFAAQAMQDNQPVWLLIAGSSAFLLGAVLGVAYVIRLALTPEIYWRSETPSRLALAYLIALLFGMFVFGFLFVRAGLPTWLGYLTMGAAAAGLVGSLVYRTASPFYLTALLFIVNLIVGIALAQAGG